MKIGDLFRKEINRRIRAVKATEQRNPRSDFVKDGKAKRKNNFENARARAQKLDPSFTIYGAPKR